MLSMFRPDCFQARGGALALALATTLVLPAVAAAQGRTLTAQDYARAERFVGYNANPLVDHAVTRVAWLDDGRFWFRDHDADGDRVLVMEAAPGAKPAPAFDHARMAEALAKATGKPVPANKRPVTGLSMAADDGCAGVQRAGRYACKADLSACAAVAKQGGDEPGVPSPDGRLEAFVRDWNLWVRDVATGKETQLTRDGSTDYGY